MKKQWKVYPGTPRQFNSDEKFHVEIREVPTEQQERRGLDDDGFRDTPFLAWMLAEQKIEHRISDLRREADELAELLAFLRIERRRQRVW